MATPPFRNIRLAPKESFDQKAQQETFDAIERNFEDAYQTFSSTAELAELKKKVTAAEAKKEIVGYVNSSGTPEAGLGFTATRTATGTYTVTLNAELSTLAVCVPAVISGQEATVANSTAPNKKVFTIQTFSIPFTLHNANFDFIIRQT